MRIKSRQFGALDVDEGKAITMPAGIPGFPGRKHFVILEREKTRPFLWYQCIDDPNLAFVIINPYLFKPDYSIDLPTVTRDLGWDGDQKEDIKVYVIVNAPEGRPDMITANLLGPLLINLKRGEAVQIVVSRSEYSHRYQIFQGRS